MFYQFLKKNISLRLFLILFFTFFFSTKVFAASFNFVPANPALDQECDTSMDIYVDATGEDSNAADIEISYNTSQITILDADGGTAGVQIVPGTAYEDYFANLVDTTNGKIRIGAASYTTTLTTNALFATINFKSNIGVTASDFTITFTGVGDTLDSNIAETSTGNDILTSVTNGHPTFVVSSCTTVLDNTPPVINFVNPTDNQTNVSVSQPLTINLTDDYSGIDLSTLQIIVNGNVYAYGSPYITVTGSPTNYTVTFNEPGGWSYGTYNTIQVLVQDLSGKSANSTMHFNTELLILPPPPPPPPVTPPPVTPPPTEPPPVSAPEPPPPTPTTLPTIIFVNPVEGATNVPQDTSIIVQIEEGTNGVDFGTLTFNINGVTYTTNDPNVTVYYDNGKYIFTIKPKSPFGVGQIITVIVNGKDLKGNSFSSTLHFSTSSPLENLLQTIIGKDQFPQLKGTIFGEALNIFGLSGILSIVTLSLLLIFALINGANILSTGLGIIAILLNKRKRPWGVIVDASSNKPISFATCVLIKLATNEIVAQTVSSLDGTYGFAIEKGDYGIQVKHPQYKIFRAEIDVPDSNSYVYDIKMALIDSAYVSQMKFGDRVSLTFLNIYNQSRDILFILGFLFAVLSIIISPSIFNWIIFGLYIIIVLLNVSLIYRSSRMFSAVLDAQTGERVPYAIVKIFELNTWKNLDTLVCNSNGYFDYFGPEGEYGVIVAAKGYKFPSKSQADLPIITDMYSGMLKAKLTRGQNRLSLFLDQESGMSVSVNESHKSKLQTPFG